MLREDYLFKDVDLNDYKLRAESQALIINSHGDDIFGRLLIPAAESADVRTPVAIFLHGYPGNEQNLDITQALRRAGIAVFHFSYRGVWGSHGNYCLSHLIEDTHVVLNYLAERADQCRLDMTRVYLVGHSMGGFTTLNTLAEGIAVKGAVAIAPCDMGDVYLNDKPKFEQMMLTKKKGYFTLPEENYIEEDLKSNALRWRFINLADKIDERIPIHFVGGAVDGVTPPDIHIKPIYQKLSKLGRKTSYTELNDGHAFPDHRTALTKLVFQKIYEMENE